MVGINLTIPVPMAYYSFGGRKSSLFGDSTSPETEVRMLGIETLHHVSVAVTDLERAKRFYSEVLGLAELERPAFDFPGAWYGLGDRQLHLIVHSTPRTLRGTTAIDSRDGHFALRVRDHEATVAHLRSHGVPVKESRVNPTPWAQIHVTDPDGNVIELNAER